MGEKPGRARARKEDAWQGMALHTTMKRVKVYRLEDNGKWDDRGTGHVTIDYLEGSRELVLVVVDEEDNDTLLLHNITPDDIYRKQEETIISWRDPEKALELALSFQEPEGCSFIWENMCNIREDLQSKILRSHEVGRKPTLKSLVASRGSLLHGKSLSSVNGELKELPPLEMSSLSVILETMQCDMTEKKKMRVTDSIPKDHDFSPKLVNLFRTCKDLGDTDGLHMIFRLVKAIILLNSSAIFDRILSADLILDIIGVLEYDPEVHIVQSQRAFLKDHAVLKEAMPIRKASVVSKLHQTYYIKEFLLPKVLHDATQKSINTIIDANNASVVSSLKDDADFMQDLFERMGSSKSELFVDNAETEESTSVGRGLDKEEEDYFITVCNEEDSATQTTQPPQQRMVKLADDNEIHHIPGRPKSGGLMDHDDGRDYKQSPKRPVEADETLNVLRARHSSLDGKDTDGIILKKPKRDFPSMIVNLFRTCKDLEDRDGLRLMQSHRALLTDHGVIKEAIPTIHASVVSKVHQRYRIRYIKDFWFNTCLLLMIAFMFVPSVEAREVAQISDCSNHNLLSRKISAACMTLKPLPICCELLVSAMDSKGCLCKLINDGTKIDIFLMKYIPCGGQHPNFVGETKNCSSFSASKPAPSPKVAAPPPTREFATPPPPPTHEFAAPPPPPEADAQTPDASAPTPTPDKPSKSKGHWLLLLLVIVLIVLAAGLVIFVCLELKRGKDAVRVAPKTPQSELTPRVILNKRQTADVMICNQALDIPIHDDVPFLPLTRGRLKSPKE